MESGKVPNRMNISWKNTSFYCVRKNARKARQKILSDIAASKVKAKNLNDQSLGNALAGIENVSGVPTLTPGQVADIYTGKCKDLRVGRAPNQELRFQEYCRKFCIDGKIILRDVLYQLPVVRISINRI
jgi:hypothetical protein